MSFLRPEAIATILRLREALGALFAIAVGLWMFTDPGPVVRGVGVVIALVGAGLLINALRRLRFVGDQQAPGVVIVDEGQVNYLGPVTGGMMGLRELDALRLRSEKKQKSWVLVDAQGNMLSIPHGAKGESALFDAFSALPGMSMSRLLMALENSPPGSSVVWQRTGASSATRLTSPPPHDTP